MQHQAGPSEHRAEERGQRRGHLAELREDQHLLLPGRDHLGELAQPRQLAAVAFASQAPSPSQCDGMVADLLEAHQIREHEAAALDALAPRASCVAPARRPPARRAPPAVRLSRQNAFTSVLSGRSAMTVLSVFSRRRM